jgi:hypothetical protein
MQFSSTIEHNVPTWAGDTLDTITAIGIATPSSRLLGLPDELLLDICMLISSGSSSSNDWEYRCACSRLSNIGLDIICSRVHKGLIPPRVVYHSTESSLKIIEGVSQSQVLAPLITHIVCQGLVSGLYHYNNMTVSDILCHKWRPTHDEEMHQESELHISRLILFRRYSRTTQRLQEALSTLSMATTLTFECEEQIEFRSKGHCQDLYGKNLEIIHKDDRSSISDAISPWRGFCSIITALVTGTRACNINKLVLVDVVPHLSALNVEEYRHLQSFVRRYAKSLEIRTTEYRATCCLNDFWRCSRRSIEAERWTSFLDAAASTVVDLMVDYEPTHINEFYELNDRFTCLLCTTDWKQLRCVKFRGMDFSQQGLKRFLSAHITTLADMKLLECDTYVTAGPRRMITSGSWIKILRTLSRGNIQWPHVEVELTKLAKRSLTAADMDEIKNFSRCDWTVRKVPKAQRLRSW